MSAIRVRPRSKYHAKPCVVDGIRFASQREATRYGELKLLEKAGEIQDLSLQPRYDLMAKRGGKIGESRADFVYWDQRAAQTVVEDVKGFKTPLYRWKVKHMAAQYGIVIREL